MINIEDERQLIFEIIGQRADPIAEEVLHAIHHDIAAQHENHLYSDTLIRKIIISSQELESLLREFIKKNGIHVSDLWKQTGGKLLTDIAESGMFDAKQIDVLFKIIDFRNWVIHEIYGEAQKFGGDSPTAFGDAAPNTTEWTNHYRRKLAVTKSLMHEAVDLFKGTANVLSGI